ncbi:MAG TPA: class I SAM-dependent methyltransferase [Chitinophagaceae bacterium]|nr:class I SAM-dependent methyltransferase [Chitinophagaceae bacterium]
MALEHHSNHRMRFDQQVENSRNYVIPFIELSFKLKSGMKILEIGCGEGGVLKPFAERGCIGLGVDLDQIRIDLAEEFLHDDFQAGRIQCIYKNILDADFQQKYHQYFDLIILKDVIEHIHDQASFFPPMSHLLKPQGHIFFGFPPWQMPFGGHQQTAQKKWTSKLPYYHLLPFPLYKAVLKMAGESENVIDQLLEIKETGISIERFERIAQQSGFSIRNKQWFLINPIYKYKFGLEPRKQNWLFGAIPYVRNYLTTCAYYLIRKN